MSIVVVFCCMNYLETLSHCPVCGHQHFSPFLSCQDHTLSQEKFSIVACAQCQFKFTNPRPSAQSIGQYYQSDTYISHHDEAQNLMAKVYVWVRKFTLKGKLNLINTLAKKQTSKRLLDVGCGTGMFLHACRLGGWQCSGMEPDPAARAKAEKNIGQKLLAQIDESLQKNTFDVVTLWHVLEHIHTLNETLTTLRESLKTGGHIVIAVPNHQSHDAQKYGKYWAAYDVPRHLYHFSQNTMIQLLEKHGFEHCQTHPMWFDAAYVSLLSSQYQQGSKQVFSAMVEGLFSNIWGVFNGKNYSSLIYVFKKL